MPTFVSTLQTDPAYHLAGTDLRLHLRLARPLLNEVLDARPPDTPVKKLFLDPENGNLAHLHLSIDAPVVGSINRKLTLRPGAAVTFAGNPWLHIDIVDGFRFLDKPVIRLMQNQIAEKLPPGIELTSNYLRLHVPALLKNAGYQAFIPLLQSVQVRSEANALTLDVRLKAK